MVTTGLSSVIEKRLLRLVSDHKAQLSSLEIQIRGANNSLSNAQATLERVETHRSQALSRFTAGVEALIGMANDPVVLVRNYGVGQVYHSARRPCGKANRRYAMEMPWGEAKAQGYEACSFCGWYADRDAEEVHKPAEAS